MRKLLWKFSVIWTNCILACVKKDIIDAIEILEEEIDLVQETLANKTRIEGQQAYIPNIFKSVVFNAIRNSTVFGILIKIIGKHDKETTSDLKKTFNENLKVISSDLKMFNASETRNLGRYQDGISNL